jgi:ABC-2 type transport system permease protein
MQLAAVSGIFGVVMSIGGDRWNGTLPYLFGTPANRIVMFFGRALVHVLNGILTVAIGFMWGVVLLRLDLGHTNLGLLALTILVTTLSTCGLGLLMGCIGLITVNVMFVNNTVYFLLLIFSGANIPPASLPAWMQVISNGLPLTRGIAAARALITGAGWNEIAPLLGDEILVGLAYGFLGYILFSWFETQAKRSGKLESV